MSESTQTQMVQVPYDLLMYVIQAYRKMKARSVCELVEEEAIEEMEHYLLVGNPDAFEAN